MEEAQAGRDYGWDDLEAQGDQSPVRGRRPHVLADDRHVDDAKQLSELPPHDEPVYQAVCGHQKDDVYQFYNSNEGERLFGRDEVHRRGAGEDGQRHVSHRQQQHAVPDGQGSTLVVIHTTHFPVQNLEVRRTSIIVP